jgi:hypothetical protein
MDFTRLFHYAGRRGKGVELTELLKKTDVPENIFL